ncbi:NADP-dependent 3-hydroxy acid dehydrogenase YdfG [Chitinophaga terrae (ex Kim and Jung 2007)]|uniref:NADP-dependent 3-hydroxy acid dehydrogenase YdfG n=1 Tax=Chitinophaga terrae (ex Kim and Jung 2007) TaxID=408074 RepID=A0A1H4FVI3_9BACT|nr:SDR family oxidoreductase [Chitinophaga terrae (ex Kim and Jung 2007)]MDQ0105379.1 short-subunit dehydrogenase [Chitinophaga terrae (ex Kim and Jung 2007)]GEP92857.1 oxidoreductase [Chitinophaga terrae (ex Kim and Jung 2007)]SEB00522.1 NADP-dependent 3-hydroxy acid dehydrogenase YdfG [Chitinophaga terrae (ex Kim and Jung 2007)]
MNAVITGASKGIGKAIAEKLALEGFNVAICARNAATLAETQAAVQAKNPAVKVLAIAVDMGNKEEVLAFADTVKNNFSTIDILVNNAGIYTPGAIHQEEDGLLEKLMAVNVYSAYYLTRALLPVMIAQQKGHIFNMCSTASLKSYPNGGSYSITKHALLGFSKNLREELKNLQIKVTSVNPGPTLTASWEGFSGPPERLMPPEDIASVVWSAYQMAPQTVVEEILLRPILGDL